MYSDRSSPGRRSRRGPTRREALSALAAGGAAIAGASGVRGTGTGPGDERWRYETPRASLSSPTIVDGTVYVGASSDEHGTVFAIDASDGERDWRFPTGHPVGTPTAVGDTVYVESGHLYALDATSGDKRLQHWWSNRSSSPTAVDGVIFLSSRYGLEAYNAAVGKRLWTDDIDEWVNSSLTVADGTVFAGYGNEGVCAVDAASGAERWRFETDHPVSEYPTVVDDTVFVGCANGRIYALDTDAGVERWHFETEGDLSSSPTVADGTLFVGSYDEELYAVDSATGDVLWTADGAAGNDTSPTVADGTVFAGGPGGHVHAIDAESGEERWRYEIDRGMSSAPTVVDGTLFVGTGDGTLHAVDAGVDGSSEGSRVLGGTLGHHDAWATRAAADDAPAEFVVELAPERIRVPPESDVGVTVTVENVGGRRGQREVELTRGGHVLLSETVSLAGGEATTLDHEYAVGTREDQSRWTRTLEAEVWEDRSEGVIEVDESADGLAGFGALGALGGLAGAGYLLADRFARTGAVDEPDGRVRG